MQKLVLKLSIHNGEDKRKALKSVSRMIGIDSLSVDMKESKLTVIGDIDPVQIVNKLRKQWQVDIVTVGPAKEEKKDGKDGGDKKKEGDGKKKEQQTPEMIQFQRYVCPQYCPPPLHYRVVSWEENPNACFIL